MSQCGDATASIEFWPLVCPVAQAGWNHQGNVLRSIFGLNFGRHSGKRSVTFGAAGARAATRVQGK
jgi:hypothetical protein